MRRCAEEARADYGYSRLAAGFYIALAEELGKAGITELLTFDKGMVNQTANITSTGKVNLLLS